MVDSAKFWDKIAPKYAKSKIRDMESYEYTLERTRSYLKPTDTVLELGSGTGSTALQLAPAAAKMIGTDISPEMIKIAKAKAAAEGVENADFRVLAAKDALQISERFEVVMAFNMFHLAPDPAGLVSEIYQALPVGGLFISKTPCLKDKVFGWKRFAIMAALPVMRLIGKAPAVALLNITDVDRMIADAGFEIVESGNFPSISRYVVGRRR